MVSPHTRAGFVPQEHSKILVPGRLREWARIPRNNAACTAFTKVLPQDVVTARMNTYWSMQKDNSGRMFKKS
jgi:hypothetical protein